MSDAPKQPYADDVNYWKTGKRGPDSWLDHAEREVEKAGGAIKGRAALTHEGQSVFALSFVLDGQRYRVEWPVLQPKNPKDIGAARRQAATALYHDVKARCVALKFLGSRAAFFPFLQLADGRIAAQLADEGLPDLAKMLAGQKALPAAGED